MYTKRDITEQLEKMGAPKDRVVLMHTSLRSVGEIEGGAQTLLDAMIEYFTAEGGLFCVPTHTWDNIGTDRITLDMTLSESNLGAFSEVAAADPRGIRSENPSHSIVVFGERIRALELISGDIEALTPTSPQTAYGKIYEMGGYILLVGVSHNKNTYLHTVDEILGIPNRMGGEPINLSVKRENGEIVKREMILFDVDYTDDISWRFHKYETAFRYHSCIVDGFIGNAPTQLCDAVGMKKTVELIFKNSGGVDPLADEEPIPPKWYCEK